MTLGSIGGVPIIVTPSWVLSVVVIAAFGVPVIIQVVPGTGVGTAVAVSVVLGVLLGVSVLAHELGHCLVARLIGIPVSGVRLYLLSGVSELTRTPKTPRDEAAIAAAGPAVSALLAGIFWLAVRGVTVSTVSWLVLILLALANAVVAVFNLLPALPMDGGRVLRAAVWKAFDDRGAGTAVAVVGGYLVAVALGVWSVLLVVSGGIAGALPACIGIVMAAFVAVGAAQERAPRERTRWPAGVPLAPLARPVVRLPAETPVWLALESAANHGVILTEEGGIARGLMDVPAARELATHRPQAPASLVARPVSADAVILADDDPADVVERLRTTTAVDFLLVDDAGSPTGVIRRLDIIGALVPARSRRRGRQRAVDGVQPPGTAP